MKYPHRQAINLSGWKAKKRKKNDPQYSGRTALKPAIAAYIAECVVKGLTPELFIGVWTGIKGGHAGLGIAIPYEYSQAVEDASLESFLT